MQISASVKPNTVEIIKEIAVEENQTFSSMVNIILTNTAANWIKAKSSPIKKQSTKTKKP